MQIPWQLGRKEKEDGECYCPFAEAPNPHLTSTVENSKTIGVPLPPYFGFVDRYFFLLKLY